MIENIRRMELNDIEEVTDLFINNIVSLHSSLGRSFNISFYKKLLKEDFGFVYTIKENEKEKIIGAITGVINKKKIINFKLLFLVFLNFIKKPIIFFDLLNAFLDKDESKPELFSITVDNN